LYFCTLCFMLIIGMFQHLSVISPIRDLPVVLRIAFTSRADVFSHSTAMTALTLDSQILHTSPSIANVECLWFGLTHQDSTALSRESVRASHITSVETIFVNTQISDRGRNGRGGRKETKEMALKRKHRVTGFRTGEKWSGFRTHDSVESLSSSSDICR
jgi:hypothetical protein